MDILLEEILTLLKAGQVDLAIQHIENGQAHTDRVILTQSELSRILVENLRQRDQITELQDKGTKLLTAWRDLKWKVEEYVAGHNYLHGSLKDLSDFVKDQKAP